MAGTAVAGAGRGSRDRLAASVKYRPGLELGQFGAGHRDPHLLCAEVDDHGGFVLDPHNPAESIFVVSDLVLSSELLRRRGRRRRLERTCGQVTPGRGAGRLHLLQYALMACRCAPSVARYIQPRSSSMTTGRLALAGACPGFPAAWSSPTGSEWNSRRK